MNVKSRIFDFFHGLEIAENGVLARFPEYLFQHGLEFVETVRIVR